MTAMPPPTEPPVPSGISAGWLSAVKGLTLTNAVVIAVLIVVALPAYVVYRLVSDEELLDRFLSSYKVTGSQISNCTLRKAREHGGPYSWAISTGFAFEGGSRWSVGVVLPREPGDEEISSYCDTLQLLVDYMRDPTVSKVPVFPKTNKPVLWEHHKG